MNNRFADAFRQVAKELLAMPRRQLVEEIDAMQVDPFMSGLKEVLTFGQELSASEAGMRKDRVETVSMKLTAYGCNVAASRAHIAWSSQSTPDDSVVVSRRGDSTLAANQSPYWCKYKLAA